MVLPMRPRPGICAQWRRVSAAAAAACTAQVTGSRWVFTKGKGVPLRSTSQIKLALSLSLSTWASSKRKPPWSGSGRQDYQVQSQSRAVRYSTSRPPEKDRSTNEHSPEPKKPLLKVLAHLTPHENIYTIPNILTFSRLIAAPVIGYLVLHDYHAWAVGLFAYAGITDLVDGWVARRWNLQTVVGTVIDPMADKTLMTILTVCLAIKGALPVWLAGLILGRDVGLAITAIYYRWISLPPPKTFSRYWDFSLPSAEVHPTTISKYNTALQLALIGLTTAMPLVTVDVSSAMTAMQYLVATTTVWSGASYIYTKDAVRILGQEVVAKMEKEQKK